MRNCKRIITLDRQNNHTVGEGKEECHHVCNDRSQNQLELLEYYEHQGKENSIGDV